MRSRLAAATVLVWLLLGSLTAAEAAEESTIRLSVSSAGVEANHRSAHPAISANGRFVAFSSVASNLVDGDINETNDVFVRDVVSGETEILSLSSDGGPSDGPILTSTTNVIAISDDGNVVAFISSARNLVPDGTNGRFHVFVRDRRAGTTELVSKATDGTEGNAHSSSVALSRDGSVVAFQSFSNNLVVGDTNGIGVPDVFVHDRGTGVTERVSVATDGSEGTFFSGTPDISADGRYVVFMSQSHFAPGETGFLQDIFLRDREAGTTTRISEAFGGGQANNNSRAPSISADGQRIAFASAATNLTASPQSFTSFQVFVHDREDGATSLVSVSSSGDVANQGVRFTPTISGDGSRVTWGTLASNLVPQDTNNVGDVFVRHLDAGTTRLASVADDSAPSNGYSDFPQITQDGSIVVFQSEATNLVAGDDNGQIDIFGRGPWCGPGPVGASIHELAGDEPLVEGIVCEVLAPNDL